MPIRCAFFDFDEVLRTWKYDRGTHERLFGTLVDAFDEAAFSPESLGPALRGEVTDEEWRAGIGQTVAERFPDKDVAGALAHWSSYYGVLVPEVLEIVQACKSNVAVGLMTNATSALDRHMEILGIAELFDYVVNASGIGSIKPEPEIYLHALKVAGINASEAFFADDRPENIEAAERVGYIGHVFENADGLRMALVNAGVLS
jgi:putative hydrolase of the HAD superfamily